MNIKNQIRLSVLISLILVVVISVSIVVSYQNMQVLQRQESLAADVVRGSYELTYLSNDYLINAEPRARLQLEERDASLQPIISQLKPENEEEAQSLAIIRDYNEKSGMLFREIPEPGALSNGAVMFPTSYQQVTWSRINVQSQGMIYEAWRLRHLYNDDVSEARFWNNILVVVLMVLMLIIIGVNYMLISRRLVRSIREVDAGSRTFATGNLDYRIPLQGTDEIGNIGAGLNIMATNLKTITASRDELDREIDQRRHTEARLKETNEYLTSLFDYANAPIIVWDMEFRITRFNHAFERLTGRTEQAVIGQHLEILFPELSREVSLDLIRKTLAGERWEIVEIPILHVSGETRIVLWNSANLVDHQGTIISTIAQGQDITGRKVAEDALRKSEEKYRILFTRMVEGSALHEIIYDPSGNPVDYRILDVNPAFESIVGIRREEIIGKTSRQAYGVDIPPYFDIYARVATTGQPEWFEVYFAPMKKHFAISAYSTQKGRFASIFEDITGRKEAEELREHLIRELEQKNAELERFTYTVSHDLKSPLITIQGFAGLLEDDALNGDPLLMKKDIHRITTAANIMQALLSDLIDLSRVGKIINPPQKIPFGTIVNEAVDLLAGPLSERGVTVDLASSLPVVNVDRTRIREVMVNLIENALKFLGDQTDPVIRIGADMNGKTPVFFVQDNGIGIDPRYLERIFNLFERLDASAQGTGIGLTIVRRIIEVHGGKIWAESEGQGKGTTFRFTLPVVTEGV